MVFGELFALFFLFFIIVGIASTAFWIWMLIDAAQREFKKDNDKVIWILVIVLVGGIGALIYYFMVKRTGGKIGKK